MRYQYCPQCGTKLTTKTAGDDGEVPFCASCGKYRFDSFASCVIVLTYNEYDEIVLCRQNYLSDRYTSVTSGYIAPGETAEEAAVREVREELGIDLESLEYAGTVWFDKGDMLMHAFVGFAHKCELKLSKEIDSAQWVPYKEAPDTMFPDRPGNALYTAYRKYLEIRGFDGKRESPDPAFQPQTDMALSRLTYEEAVRTIPPGRYRHMKGGEYEVIGIARHSETEAPMVVYKALYGDGGIWCRPAGMWNERVIRNGIPCRRFYRLDRIERVEKYERLFNDAATAPDPEKLRLLDAYYTSGEWLEDYEADENGELPPELKRGVLSQDALYDLLESASEATTHPDP